MEQVRELAEVVLANNEMWEIYGGLLALIHPEMRKELQAMAKKRNKGDIDWRAFLNSFEKSERVLFKKWLIDEFGVEGLLADLTPKQREEARRRLQADDEKRKNATAS